MLPLSGQRSGTISNSYLPNGVTNAVLALELLPKVM